MKRPERYLAVAAIVFTASAVCVSGQNVPAIEPDGTYMYVQKDTSDLFLDIYYPADGSEEYYNGMEKPAVLFVFGGGFISGRRDEPYLLPWYRELTERGYKVIAIDYRLGLKGAKAVGVAQVDQLDKAIHMAVEDLFSATSFITENADALGISPDNIVLCGSSAGAITILQAEYELCNETGDSAMLPDGFRYAGLMAFSGGILSRHGKLKFNRQTSPVLMLHGTDDKLVNYSQIRFFNLGFFGSDKIADRLSGYGCRHWILRYPGHGHEIANIMGMTVDIQDAFIKSIMDGSMANVDATVSDPAVPSGKGSSQSRKELYGSN